jgi:hypothetical protein
MCSNRVRTGSQPEHVYLGSAEIRVYEHACGRIVTHPKMPCRLCTAEVRGSISLGSTLIIPLTIDAMSPLASTEPPLVPVRASPPQLRLQTLDQQALFIKLLQKTVPLPPKDNDAPNVLGMLRYLV